MSNKKIIIAGLPNAGKTTYIAALNGLIRGNTEFSLVSNGVSKEQAYLNKITDKWLQCKEVLRSTEDTPLLIDFPLLRKDDGVAFSIEIPDVMGEIYEDIIRNDFNNEFEQYCKGASGIFFFINNMEDLLLKEEAKNAVGDTITENTESQNTDEIVITSDRMTSMVKNILVLKYLRQTIGNVRLVVAVSSWDKEETRFDNIEDYFTKKCPALYNYICYHFTEFKLYGISAQGADYRDGTNNLEEKMDKNERAYVFDSERHNDLSLPLVYLIE